MKPSFSPFFARPKNLLVIFLSLNLAISKTPIFAQTPVAYYPFSGNANDAVGSNNGTINGATLTTDRFGNPNSAYRFNGIDDFITVATGINSVYTISAWVKFEDSPANKGIVTLSSGSGAGSPFSTFSHQIRTNATGNFRHYLFADVILDQDGNTTPVQNEWVHVTISAAANGQMKLYVNGVPDAAPISIGTPWNGGSFFHFGNSSGFGAGRFKGVLDDIKIYNTQLSDAQVLNDYVANANNLICATVNEGGTATLTAPPGKVFTAIDFASYGNPLGECGAFSLGNCHASNSKTIVESILLGQNSGSIQASNSQFGDPCFGTVKRLSIQARYGNPNSAVQLPGSGKAISFDGANDRIESPTQQIAVDNFTVEAWVNPGAETSLHGQSTSGTLGTSGNNQYLLFPKHGGSSAAGAGFSVGTNGVCVFEHGDFYLPSLLTWSGTLSGWNHIAVVYTNKQPQLYVNGILVATGLTSLRSQVFVSKESIGGGVYGHFLGQADEFRVWNSSLSQEQIRDRMCRKITLSDALFSNLVTYYNFDESDGNTAFDGSTLASNGTLTNSPTRVISGAPIGNTSAHNYVSSGFPAANLSVNGQDNLAVAYTAGTFTGTAGTHIYAVTEKPNTEAGIESPGANNRYFGVFNVGLSNPTYTATYNYTGNPFVTAGNEGQLALFKRSNNAATSWTNAGATLNTTANTLTANGQSTEYVLGVANCTPPPAPTITASGPITFCQGDSVTLTSSAAAGNIWSNGATSQSIKVKNTGNFSVQVVVAGCTSAVSAVTSVTVNTPPAPAAITSPSGLSFCSGSSLTLQADQTTLLQWQRNGVNLSGQTNQTLVVNTAGTYRVLRTQNGCSSTSNALVITENSNVPPTPTINSGGQNSFCANASLGLLSSATEGNQWIRNGTDITGATANTFNATQAGTYAVRVTVNGCSSTSANLVLTTLSAPTVNISASAPGICPSNPVVLSTSGTTLSAREWLKDGISTGQFGTTFSASIAGSYSVIGTAANGCQTTSAAVNVQADVVPALTSNQPANTICSGNSITLTSSPGTGFLWNTGATTSSITVSPANTGNFSVQTTGALGCVFNNAITVTVVPSLTPAQVSNMLPDNGSINQENSITFSWQPANNAIAYDLYVWPAPGVRPASPTIGGITNISATLHNLSFGTLYNYQVVSRSACLTTDAPVQQFTTRNLPDLVVSNVQAQAISNVPVLYQVTYTVTNQGTGVSLPGTWKDRLYLSLDSAEGGDILVQTKDNMNALAPGASYNGSFQTNINLVGEYFLYVKTDVEGNVLEVNESNNVAFRNPGRVLFQELTPKPDLVGLGPIQTTPNALGGASVQFNYRVLNQGSAHAEGNAVFEQCNPPQCRAFDKYWEDQVFISKDSIFNGNAVPIGTVRVIPRLIRSAIQPSCDLCNGYNTLPNNLPIDSSMLIFSNNLSIPHNFVGKSFLFVRMNEGVGVFDERFKQNNILQSNGFNVILRPPADLQVSNVSLTPTSSQQGNTVKVKYRVRNIGVNSPVPTEMQWTDRVYLSKTPVLNKNTALVVYTRIFPLSSFPSNAFYDDSTTFQIPFLDQTPLFVFVEADAGNIVFEHTFEANNLSAAQQLNLDLSKKPDYVPSAFTAPTTAQAGSSLSVSVTINNSGNANGVGSFYVAFRVKPVGSTDAPMLILNQNVSAIQTGANRLVAVNPVLPASLLAGQYELSVFADFDQTQPELNENNNVQTRTITVIAAPSFDLGVSSISAPETVAVFQSQPTIEVGGQAFFNVTQSGPNLPTSLIFEILVGQNANGGNPLYVKTISLNFPGGIPASFTLPTQTIQRNTVPIGNYFVVVRLLANNEFSLDVNPANNLLSKPIFFEESPTPDIVFHTHPSNATLVSGQSFSLPLEIKNTGINALEGAAVVRAYISNSPSLQVNMLGGVGSSAKIPGITQMPTNQIVKDTVRGFVPLTYAGNYFLQLVVDGDYKTYEGESGEANNVVVIPLIVSPPILPDLVADPLVLPASFEAGRRLNFNYTLRNNGSGSFIGLSKNNFRLSKTGGFNPLTDGEVGTHQPLINLAPGNNVSQSSALTANGLMPGAYKRGVFVNSSFSVPESNFGNNENYSSGTSNVFINPLNLNVLASENSFVGDYFYRSVNIGAGFDILAEFVGKAGYASKDKVPTASASDFLEESTQTNEILIPNSEAGQYFFGVRPNDNGSVQLRVRALPFSIISLTPNKVGQGNATVEIRGAAFTSQTIFVLRNAGGTNVDTGTIRILKNSMQARVTFHCKNLPTGFYTVRAIKPGNEVTDLANGLQVLPKSPGGLIVTTDLKTDLFVGASMVVKYIFTNSGNTDVDNGFGRIMFPAITHVKNVTISSNAEGMQSLLAKSGVFGLNKPIRYQMHDLYAIIPAWKRNMAPGESFQISFEMDKFGDFGNFSVNEMAQDLTNTQLHEMLANEMEKLRGLSIQKQAEITNPQIRDSLGGYWSFQRLAFRNLRSAGFFSDEDMAQIASQPYYPSLYQAGTMKGYGVLYDVRPVEELSLRLICEAPLSEYNLPNTGEQYLYYANDALVTYSSNYRRSAQDLIASACNGDSAELRRRLQGIETGGGLVGNLETGFLYGPMIYVNIFGTYVPNSNNSPIGQNPVIQSEGGSFMGSKQRAGSETFIDRDPPAPPPPAPTSPPPPSRQPDPTPSLEDLAPPGYRRPNSSCTNVPPPPCETQSSPKPIKLRCKQLYTICTVTLCNSNFDALGAFCYPNQPFFDQKCVTIRHSCDPNEIEGPEGYGDSKFVAKTDVMPYIIRFENDPKFADASASIVRIVQPLDANFEAGTFQLKQFGFENRVFDIPAGQSSFSTQIDLTAEKGIKVNVLGAIDVVNKQLFWQFVTVDAATGQTSVDPNKGFLPVNDSTGKGEGFVSYTIQPGLGTNTGDSLRAQAEIVFDFNEAIVTNRHFNVVDALPPSTTVVSPSGTQAETDIAFEWTAADDVGGSGADRTWILFKKDAGPLDTLDYYPADTGSVIVFGFETGHTYQFFFRTVDHVGNLEALPASPNMTVTIGGTPCNDPAPTISAGGPTTFCAGGSVVLTSNKPTGNVWSNGATTQSITVSASGTFTVKTVIEGCTSAVSAPTLVTVNPLPPKPTITPGGPTSFCQGGFVQLTTNAAVGHKWNTGATTASITVTTSGTFADTAIALGCKNVSDPVLVTVNPKPTVFAGEDVSIEAGSSAVLTASGALTYQWSPLVAMEPANGVGETVTVSPTQTTLYTVTGTDANDCSNTDQVLVTVTGGSGPLTTPIITPGTGTYPGPQTVSITTTSVGAEIYYTTNGNVPVLGTVFTKQYTGPFQVLQTGTVRAMAVRTGQANSAIAVAFLTITSPGICAAPQVSPAAGTYEGSATVSMSTSTEEGEIWYTTNGNNPRFDVPNSFTKRYVSPFVIYANTRIRAITIKAGLVNSPITTVNYTLTAPAIVATPTFSPLPGTYGSAQSITLSTTTPEAQIYYTTNGNVPRLDVPNSFTKLYTGPFLLSQSATIRAVAVRTGWLQSGTAVGIYTFGGARSAVAEVTEIGEGQAAQQFHLFPNPNSGSFRILTENVEEETEISIQTTLGQTIWAGKLIQGQNQVEVDISRQPAGIYSVRILSGSLKKEMRITKL